MADNTKIEWANATVNAVNGCTVLSAGCTNCYAMRLAGTRLRHHPSRAGLTIQTKAGPVWNGEVSLNEEALLQPLKWRRPRKIFWNAHGDLFHQNVPDDWIDKVLAVCVLTPHHTHMILTKRSKRMREYMISRSNDQSEFWAADALSRAAADFVDEDGSCAVANWINGWSRWKNMPDDGNPLNGSETRWPLPNVWLGVSVEDQDRADERIPDLLETPAAVRFISAEPLLGPVDLMLRPVNFGDWDALRGREYWGGASIYSDSVAALKRTTARLDWVIVGGESGPGARPMHPDWVRSLRDQCQQANVPFFFKQWGAWTPLAENRGGYWPVDATGCITLTIDGERKDGGWPMQLVGKGLAGRMLDGAEHSAFPEPQL